MYSLSIIVIAMNSSDASGCFKTNLSMRFHSSVFVPKREP